MQYTLNLDCPVKWTATQEKSISNELPSTEVAPTSSSACVANVYHQALWLPESIMPLDRLIPALTCAVPVDTSGSATVGLLELIKPHLMTPRQVTEKYYKRIAALVDQEDSTDVDSDDELMWYAVRYDKGLPEDGDAPEQHRANYEAWKKAWLSRMEQREIMIQILLHFLLLTLPNLPQWESIPSTTNVTAPGSSPHKRKRAIPTVTQDILSRETLEERLEVLMDKLAMWQLTGSIDPNAGGDGSAKLVHRLTSLHKDKHHHQNSPPDDRDWMQIFCEDIVEPTFRAKLPAQCALLRSKVFQTSPFDDDEEEDLSFDLQGEDTPPASPRLNPNPKRMKSSGGGSRTDAHEGKDRAKGEKRDLSRTKSLSITLEEEERALRARSRSLSIGPNTMQKRALAREVSMSTAFNKVPEKHKKRGGQGPSGKRTAPPLERTKSTADKAKDKLGTTLVAATPVKPKNLKSGRSFSTAFRDEKDVLPYIIDVDDPNASSGSSTRFAVEGGDDDDDWMPQSSPDILLLGDEDRSTSPGTSADGFAGTSDVNVKGRLGKRRSILVEGTPTKPCRK